MFVAIHKVGCCYAVSAATCLLAHRAKLRPVCQVRGASWLVAAVSRSPHGQVTIPTPCISHLTTLASFSPPFIAVLCCRRRCSSWSRTPATLPTPAFYSSVSFHTCTLSVPQKEVFKLEQDASDDIRTDPRLLRACKQEIARMCSDQDKHGGKVQVGCYVAGRLIMLVCLHSNGCRQEARSHDWTLSGAVCCCTAGLSGGGSKLCFRPPQPSSPPPPRPHPRTACGASRARWTGSARRSCSAR